ncbi:DUF3168 domain-containing protein [Pelagibacterium sp. H642]|uniref:DUF3168 domain-containing protein n=1 Tax=Pelagibacterium sp. H642 TaxID=1881069 RepID=UPI002815E3A8|nr:DUF3168 domain-containing protein [Pelagibacterium sp. H642]WMT90986.1 DUF3168 domain-containing protein [Pelagibacterium sp. H642]
MADQSFDLMFAMLTAMRADAGISALVPAGHIFADSVPPDTEPPYVVIGDTDAHREDATCVSAQGIFVTLHVWSWGSGDAYNTTQARRICDAVYSALHDRSLPLASNHLVTIEHRRTRVFKDADGIKNHGVIEFWAGVEEA